jgi:hypothetical protein
MRLPPRIPEEPKTPAQQAQWHDNGPAIRLSDHTVQSQPDSMNLSMTGFKASVDFCTYPEPKHQKMNFVNLEITLPRPYDNGWILCFSREILTSFLPQSVLSAKAKDIICFDEASRLVTFTLGEKKYTYTLPTQGRHSETQNDEELLGQTNFRAVVTQSRYIRHRRP